MGLQELDNLIGYSTGGLAVILSVINIIKYYRVCKKENLFKEEKAA